MDENDVKTVLVADDEESIREIAKVHLEGQGYNVITSENGEDAIKALQDNNISLAITDLKMPKVDGFGVLDYIKEHYSIIPAIVITGYVDVEFAVEAMKKGCFDYITKPIKKDEFIDVVEKALRHGGSTEDLKSFEISGVYLLNDAGVVIFHKDVQPHPKFDSYIFGSMFTAVKTFIKDSFQSDEELRYIEHGSLKIIVEEGAGFFLVVVGKGNVTELVKENMKNIVKDINTKFGSSISNWSGNDEVFDDIGVEFESLTKMFKSKESEL